MQRLRVMVGVAVLAAVLVPGLAAADRGGRHRGASIGLFMGAPIYWGWPGPYYVYPPPPYTVFPQYAPYPPYYAYPPRERETPPVYIEREREGRESGYWYYCRHPEGFYPDVKDCPDGWERVAPRSSR